MLEVIYDLTIWPIWLLLEVVFNIAYTLCNDPGISIIFVSLVVNILVLPLYLKSDALQENERRKQKDMEHWVRHIRKTFKGDERFMILSEYYRQNDYQPWYVLKSSLSLLLQIPFFIAAYSYLSGLAILQGTSFGPIRDLAQPDALIGIGSIRLNVLPILMTVINLASSYIYTRKGPVREKIQTVAMALVFLVLLYGSPSGLVFYWTLNNLFSLCKNIVMSLSQKLGLARGYRKTDNNKAPAVKADSEGLKNDRDIWLTSSIFITILLGAFVPLAVIVSSPLELVTPGKFADPTAYVITTTAGVAGFLLVWGTVIYNLGTPFFRKVCSRVSLVAAVTFVMNYFIFDGYFGILSDDLNFADEVVYGTGRIMINIVVTLLVVLVLIAIARKYPRIVVSFMTVLAISVFAISAYQAVRTSVTVRASDNYKDSTNVISDPGPVFTLSKTGKNVVVICVDKAIGDMVPYIINEKPELAEEYSGFVFYPNTVSLAGCTLMGIPALYGGYEYTAWNINQRPDETMKDKMNQALTLMPLIFSKEGYQSTICDLPYGDFTDEGNPGIFDDIEGCEYKRLVTGAYYGMLTDDEVKATSAEKRKRNFLFYSLCKVMPLALQSMIYDDGKYLTPVSNWATNAFANSYAILKNMSALTDYTDDPEGRLIVMHNFMSHEGTYLDPPDYVLKSNIHDKDTEGKSVMLDSRLMRIEDRSQLAHYDTNMATYLLIANWLQTLKDQGVYDNTRIVIVADHGYDLYQFDDMRFEDIHLNVEAVNPVLMFKDFGATGYLETDDTFMSNADVPSMAMKDIIPNPVNPYSGVPIDDSVKKEGPLIITNSTQSHIEKHKENVYDIGEWSWYKIKDDIFNRADWSLYEP